MMNYSHYIMASKNESFRTLMVNEKSPWPKYVIGFAVIVLINSQLINQLPISSLKLIKKYYFEHAFEATNFKKY